MARRVLDNSPPIFLVEHTREVIDADASRKRSCVQPMAARP